ncbi:uncharacterized protein LOC118514478 [Anopheles stephensi]|uniref:uncharacterized protein LOC118514478 n=1 Tax=Anopheles stephensi TaxID=30069 RepID=UPI001658AB68|nr:uncharacterized protein LOC118514478 [Anopheles stephensi]
MDRYLRLFIKYQAYMIVVFTLLMVVLLTPFMAQHKPSEIENLRFGGKVAGAFGFIWITAVISLVAAIHKEDATLIFPYLFVFGVDLALLLLREIYLITTHGFFVEFLAVKIVIAAITIPYVFASLLALHRLFTVDPIETHRNGTEGFVRFDRNETNVVAVNHQHNATSTPTPNGTQVV